MLLFVGSHSWLWHSNFIVVPRIEPGTLAWGRDWALSPPTSSLAVSVRHWGNTSDAINSHEPRGLLFQPQCESPETHICWKVFSLPISVRTVWLEISCGFSARSRAVETTHLEAHHPSDWHSYPAGQGRRKFLKRGGWAHTYCSSFLEGPFMYPSNALLIVVKCYGNSRSLMWYLPF